MKDENPTRLFPLGGVMKVKIKLDFGKLKEVKISMTKSERREIATLIQDWKRYLFKTNDGVSIIFTREEDDKRRPAYKRD